MATASTAPPTIDSTISGILKNGRTMGTISPPPKNAAAYAAASAATRTSWRTKPSRQPCTTSNKIKRTANKTKTACQRGEPATDGIADCVHLSAIDNSQSAIPSVAGSPLWQAVFVLFAVLLILFEVVHGWRLGLVRQLVRVAALAAAYAAAFFGGGLIVPIVRPFFKMPDIVLSIVGGAVLAVAIYALVSG